MNVQAKDVARILGGKRTLGREVRDYADLDAVVEAGLPRIAAEDMMRDLGLAPEPESTPANAGPIGSTIGVERSRVIERMARLLASAEAAFGSREAARAFLFEPHDRLAGRRPIECVETELALKQVVLLLESIAFGLPA